METKDHAVSGEIFQLRRHPELDMLVTTPIPNNLDRYYASEGYISHTDSYETGIDKLYQWVKKLRLGCKVRLMEKYARKRGQVLDIGAGTGDFLLKAREQNWGVAGIEPNSAARDRAAEKKLSLYREISEMPEGAFNAITFWHSLEHLPELDGYIALSLQKLTPNGIVMVAVPNFKSFDAKLYGEYWAGYDVPRHLWHFSQEAVQNIFARHKMELVKTKPMILDAFYICLLSEKYKTGKQAYVRAFINGLRSNLSAWRTSEYSSLLYIFKRA